MVSRVKVAYSLFRFSWRAYWFPGQYAQQQQTPTKACNSRVLAGVKNSTGGSLTIENGNLRFTHSRATMIWLQVPCKSCHRK